MGLNDVPQEIEPCQSKRLDRPLIIIIGEEGLGFEFRSGQIGTVSLSTARHRCDVSWELCSPDAKLQRGASQLVTRLV